MHLPSIMSDFEKNFAAARQMAYRVQGARAFSSRFASGKSVEASGKTGSVMDYFKGGKDGTPYESAPAIQVGVKAGPGRRRGALDPRC